MNVKFEFDKLISATLFSKRQKREDSTFTGYGNRDSTRVCIFGINDQIGQKDFTGVFSTMILSGSLVKILKGIQIETSDTFLVVKAMF